MSNNFDQGQDQHFVWLVQDAKMATMAASLKFWKFSQLWNNMLDWT